MEEILWRLQCLYMVDLEGQLEKLLGDARSSVAAAIATLQSALSMVKEHTEQIRRDMEVDNVLLLAECTPLLTSFSCSFLACTTRGA